MPILSRIPILGTLFTTKTKEVTRQNLMVFLKPYIIRSPAELVKYSRIRYNRARQAELQSLKGSSKFLVPGAKPAVLDEYDNVTGDGTFGTVRTRKLEKEYQKKQEKKAAKEALKSSKSVPEETGFKTNGSIETGVYSPTQAESLKQ